MLPVAHVHLGSISTPEVVIDMVESAQPHADLQALLLDFDHLPTEATPETNFVMAIVEAVLKLALYSGSVFYFMIFGQVGLELLGTIIRLATELRPAGIKVSFIAFPQLELVMLAVLVALPVIFTAKAFGAALKSTAVRLNMALHMLSVRSMSAA